MYQCYNDNQYSECLRGLHSKDVLLWQLHVEPPGGYTLQGEDLNEDEDQQDNEDQQDSHSSDNSNHNEGGVNELVMICPFCECRWESPDGADQEQYVICSECARQSKVLIKEQMAKNGLKDRRLFFHS